MSIEKQPKESYLNTEKEEIPKQTLEEFLRAVQEEGIKTLSAESIKKQLEQTGYAIVTQEGLSGIRIGRGGSKSRGYTYTVSTTNAFENPEHPIAKKFAYREITL